MSNGFTNLTKSEDAGQAAAAAAAAAAGNPPRRPSAPPAAGQAAAHGGQQPPRGPELAAAVTVRASTPTRLAAPAQRPVLHRRLRPRLQVVPLLPSAPGSLPRPGHSKGRKREAASNWSECLRCTSTMATFFSFKKKCFATNSSIPQGQDNKKSHL